MIRWKYPDKTGFKLSDYKKPKNNSIISLLNFLLWKYYVS